MARSKQLHAETVLKVEVLEQEVVGLKEKLEEKTRLAVLPKALYRAVAT